MVEVSSSGQRRVATNDGKISLNQGENVIKVETKTKAVAPPDQGGFPGDIQKAIDRIRLTGGVVTVRNGTYIESADITIPSNVTLVGESFGGVNIIFTGAYSIKATGSAPYSTGTIEVTQGSDTITGTDTSWLASITPGHKIKINGLPYQVANVNSDTSITLRGKFAGASDSGLSYLAAIFSERITIENIVAISQAGSSSIVLKYTDLVTINNTICVSPSINGLNISDSSRLKTEQFIIDGAGASGISGLSTDYMNMDTTVVTNSGAYGYDLTSCTGVVFTSCPSNNNAVNGYNIASCTTIAWQICQADGNGAYGINIADSSDCIFNGGDFSGNVVDGINISGDSNGNIIGSVIARGNGAYGINIADSTCDNNRITASQLFGNGSGDYNDSGTNTIIIQDGNGAVDSVNGQTGTVVLDPDDLDDTSTTNKFTDATSVDAAGATMNTDASLAGNSYFLDEDDMASDSATKVPSQQSVKAYVDAEVSGGGGGDVSGPSSSIDNEVALFNSTSGKLIKRATITGLAKLASGVLSAATAGTDYYAPGSTDVAVADGGTGSSTSSGARTNLGLVIGTDIQAHDSDLDTISSLTATTDNFIQSASSAWASRTPAQVLAVLGPLIYRVGDILESVSSVNPGNSIATGGLGFGTWAAFGTGRVTVAIDAGDADFDTVEETTGAKTALHNHDLSALGWALINMADNVVFHDRVTQSWTSDFRLVNTGGTYEGNAAARTTATALAGATDSRSVSVVQPTVVVYRWKRTA